MQLVNFQEYQEAKNQILFGTEFKEYSTLENGYIRKQYATIENGTFYEVTDTDTHITEFWSDKQPNSRYYSDKTPNQEVEIFSMIAKQVNENTFYMTLSNGVKINITKNPEHNGSIWEWQINAQVFSKDSYAENYLKKIITEKLTGNRIIYHKEKQAPDICGVNGSACRHPKECNTAICSQCPVAERFFAKRDNVKLIYVF